MHQPRNFRRTHISTKSIIKLEDLNPEVLIRITYKPRGFWYEVNDDWRRWCYGEQPDWLADHFLFLVNLQDTKILMIRTEAELNQFHKRYTESNYLTGFTTPNWQYLIEEGYDGVEIAPYQWAFRLHPDFMWYYGWDCGSGCVWNASKLKITLLTHLPKKIR